MGSHRDREAKGPSHPDVELVDFPEHGIEAYRVKGQLYANETERFWERAFVVGFIQSTRSGVLVNADDEESAVDAAADFGAEYGFAGFFLTEEDAEELGDDVLRVGNSGDPVQGSELWIVEVPHPEPNRGRGAAHRRGGHP